MSVKLLKEHLKRISKFQSASNLLHWDMLTNMPVAAGSWRAEVIGEISAHAFELFISDYTAELIDKAESGDLASQDKRVVELVKKDYSRLKKIPYELYKTFQIETSRSQKAWEEAKTKDNFDIFEPYLERVIKLLKEIIESIGYEDNRYDVLLDRYEPGLKTSELVNIIKELKTFLVAVVPEIEEKTLPLKRGVFEGCFSVYKQYKMAEEFLKLLGYDFNRGRLDTSEHPFTAFIGLGDVRITSNFKLDNLSHGFFALIHEFGHALYDLNIPQEFYGLPLGEGASMGIHESQSRFWENIIGRSFSFWEFARPIFVRHFPQLDSFTEEEFYNDANVVKRSLIRVYSDEVTYNLHIMLRFEIEEALINDRLSVKELPGVWNAKMKEYLNLVPINNRDGVLQDVHWSSGAFGYFPSYMLGNLYSAQIYYAMRSDVSEFDELVSKGDFTPIVNWLKEKIHKKGKLYDPKELIRIATGKEFDTSCFVRYIKEKYLGV